jgi:hypothetical protein
MKRIEALDPSIVVAIFRVVVKMGTIYGDAVPRCFLDSAIRQIDRA